MKQSEFNVWYLDDATLGDSLERVHDDYYSCITGEAQSNWLGGQWEHAWALYSQWQHAGGNVGPFQRAPSGGKGGGSVWPFTIGSSEDLQGIPGTINEKREALKRITSKLEVLNPHQAFVLLKNALALAKLQYVLRVSPAYLCREELRIFDRALFGSLGRVANMSLKGEVCKPQWILVVLVVGEQ